MHDKIRFLSLTLALTVGAHAQAQGLRLTDAPNFPKSGYATPAATRTADYIVALVNSEPITNNDVRDRVQRVLQQNPQSPRDELDRRVMEQLINERAQIQYATQQGLRIDDATLEQAELQVAAQNQLSVEEFRRRLAVEGLDNGRFRSELRSQLLLQRVRERESDARVRVTEADIDDHVKRQSGTGLNKVELNLAQVLILVPEDAPPAQVKELGAQAQMVADKARAGGDFAALAREFSQAPERINGGEFGPRTADRLPTLFVESTVALKDGETTGPVRSPAGFHVLKLISKRQAGLPDATVQQTRARHILLRLGPALSETDALAQLSKYREQVASGKASFESLAREHSQDGSAGAGGDLGWTNPGVFVPEFEEAMNPLKPGEMSAPTVSRFGVHLIRVEERRQAAVSQRERREQVRTLLRQRKADDALQAWARDVRAQAFVEYREAPQL